MYKIRYSALATSAKPTTTLRAVQHPSQKLVPVSLAKLTLKCRNTVKLSITMIERVISF